MFINDRKIKISCGTSRKSKTWVAQEMMWSEFVVRCSKPIRTQETYAQYRAMPKVQQDELKDVGGFVGGLLKGAARRNENVLERYLVTLDADNIQPGQTQKIVNIVAALGCAYVIYSTRKHEGGAPRLRIIFPLDQSASADEYEPIARKIAAFIGMDIFDPTTFEPVRLMFWPSTSMDGEFVFTYGDKPFLSKNGMLGLYENWKSIAEWPEVPGAVRLRSRSVKKQGNPLEKNGIVGAFCKCYDVPAAIETFIPEEYDPCGDGRYTYTGGSTVGGAVLYENGNFIYSHHATDPAGGKLCNAFDLVRLHKFSDEDADALPDTPVTQLPSFRAMCEYAMNIETVAGLMNAQRYEAAKAEFQQTEIKAAEDLSWMNKLKCNPRTGMYLLTIDNVRIILENDPMLKNRFYHDAYANRPVICEPMPWEDNPAKTYRIRAWADEDDAGLRHYIEKVYAITGKEKINDAFAIVAQNRRRNKLKEYLMGLKWDGVRRLDSLLVDYFGAADTPYTRATIRKCLTAAVTRVMEPGCKFDCMLILSGAQGIGKSTFFNILGKEWYSDSLTTFEGKDAAELVQGYWIIEAGELTGMNKSEMNTVKQFLSKRKDIYRVPYGKRTGEFPRTCIIVGTTNDTEFLKDRTGNRRFWPVDLGINPASKSVFKDLPGETDQIWAEAYLLYTLKEKIFLEGDTALEAMQQQEAHRESNPKEGIIKAFLERKVPSDWNKKDLAQRRDFLNFGYTNMDEAQLILRDRICSAEVWCECFGGDLKLMRKSDSYEINSILNSLDGWERQKSPIKFGKYYGMQRGYFRKVNMQKVNMQE